MPLRDNAPSRKPFTPERRCHWYDVNGRGYHRLDGGEGCPRNNKCYFAHPTDTEAWRTARPGGDPPLHYLTDHEYRLITGRQRSPLPPRVPYQPVHRTQRSPSPGRRRSPPRRLSREREPPSLMSRIRGRSLSREREAREREARRLGPRSSRSRSPGRVRAPRSPPPRAPRVSTGGSFSEGQRGAQLVPRSPAVYPKVEQDVPMRDAVRPAYKREDSVASSHHAARHGTPSRPAPAPITALNTPSASVAAPPSAPINSSTSGSAPGSTPVENDPIKNMLESSTLQWQQISSAVAAASSVTPSKPKTSPPNGAPGDTSSDDRVKIWSIRVDLLASAVRIHNEIRSIEKDIHDYNQLVDSFRYQALSAEDRTVIEGHLHALQSSLADKSGEMKNTITQLAAARFWPTYSEKFKTAPQDSGQEIAKQVQGLKAAVSQLQSLFHTVGTHWEQTAKTLQGNRLANIGNHAMDVSRSSQSGIGQSNALIAEVIVPKELEKIRNAVSSFEGRLGALEETVTQNNEVVQEQIDAIVAENIQALTLAATGAVQARPPAPRPTNTITAHQLKMLETLQQNAAVTAQQVQQLSQKVTDMAAANEQLQAENALLQGENMQLRQQLEERMVVQLPTGSDSAKLDQMQSEMRALNAAVVAYLAQRPLSTPTPPSADASVERLMSQLTTSLPKAIVPMIQSFKNEVQDMLRSQQVGIVQELSSSTQKSIEALRELIDNNRQDFTSAARGSLPAQNGVAVVSFPHLLALTCVLQKVWCISWAVRPSVTRRSLPLLALAITRAVLE
ncbi:hypothetical protein C8Q79DRAFT_908973 [Trametes meyenii]|nr:hypothetical protein C8Q79DRAFT_908973 [Trametes meyenii]